MAATRAKTSERKKKASKARASTRKKTAGKPAARKKTAGKKPAAGRRTGAAKRATGSKARASGKKPPAAGKTVKSAARQQPSLVDQIAPYKVKRGETYMNEDQRQHFHDLLIAWKRDLMEEADRTVHHMQDEASNFPDPNDRASQESEFSLELRTRDRERKLLRKIDKTLKRVEMDDYGWCDACGAEIGIRRLEARPTATLCFDCKTLDEIRERQKGI